MNKNARGNIPSDDLSTTSLGKILSHVTTEEEEQAYLKRLKNRQDDFTSCLNAFLAEKGLTVSDVARSSGINRNYIYNIFNGNRKNPSRDRVIAIAIGLRMNYGQTNHLLELAGLSPLVPFDIRDVRIAIAINREVENVTDLNLMLAEQNLEPLHI